MSRATFYSNDLLVMLWWVKPVAGMLSCMAAVVHMNMFGCLEIYGES